MEKQPLLFSRTNKRTEAGCDEAGRGCLAGPVVAAAVILKHPIEGLNDSKKTTFLQRKLLKIKIEQDALAFAVAYVSPRRIDEINILNASIEAMHLALKGLSLDPEYILVDGNRFKPYQNRPYECIVRGDGIYQSIAAASILAKTCRDEYMQQLDVEFPMYGWKKNMGYPTKKHEQAIYEHGFSTHHRTSFGVVKTLNQPVLFRP
jgi:ribonuclease HII